VATRLLALGAPDGRTLPVPSLARAGDAGWYRFTAVPGRAGNAVIVGHVDTYAGAAVFYDLHLLRPGDLIYVRMGGGSARFAVRSVTEVPKARFPVSRVFGPARRHQLRLITCGGDFDYAIGHYLDNIVALATWQPARHANRPGKRVSYAAHLA